MGVNFEVTGDETLYATWAPYTATFSQWGSVTGFEVAPDVDISGMRINLIIPPITHAGNPVTSIGTVAFENIANLVGIEIPASVTSIGGWAFMNSSIETVTFAPGSQLRTIPGLAFQDTANLASIEIPATVTSISLQAFLRSGIETITFAQDSPLRTIGHLAFSSTINLASIEIPAGVTSIGYSAFSSWTNQQRIYIHHDTLTPYGWNENWRAWRNWDTLTNTQIYNASVTPPVRLYPLP